MLSSDLVEVIILNTLEGLLRSRQLEVVVVIVRVYTDRSLILHVRQRMLSMRKSQRLNLNPSPRPFSTIGREVARRRRTDQKSGGSRAQGGDGELFLNFGRTEGSRAEIGINPFSTRQPCLCKKSGGEERCERPPR